MEWTEQRTSARVFLCEFQASEASDRFCDACHETLTILFEIQCGTIQTENLFESYQELVMRLLNVCFEHLNMFEDERSQFDLFAEDKVPSSDQSTFCVSRPVYTNNVLAIAGINATGKTTVLGLLELAANIIGGKPLTSAASYEGILYRIRRGVGIVTVFEQDDEIYVLKSEAGPLEKPPAHATHWKDALGFTDETLYRWRGSRYPSKAKLSDADALLSGCEVLLERRKMTNRDKSFLSHNVSIATSISKRDTSCLYQSAFDSPR